MKLNIRTVAMAMAVALPLSASQALAATQIGDHLEFSAFGTLGTVQTDTNDAQFVRDGQSTGATESMDYNVDSYMGAQLTATATQWLSGTVQLVAAHRVEDNINIEVEWAFAKLAPLKGLQIRGGRMALPLFAVSDFRNVGYANTWVRPPDEVYGLALLRRLEGADVTYRLPLGSSSLIMSALKGKSYIETASLHIDVDNIEGLNVQWENDWLAVRAGRVEGDVRIGGSDPYTFSDIGFTVDRGNIVAQGEYVSRRSGSQAGMVDADGWYVLGGYRFDSVLPFVSYGHTEPKYKNSPVHLSGEQSTIALGVRWDAFNSAAFKFQVQRVDTNDTAGISFVAPAGVLPNGGGLAPVPLNKAVNVVSLALDFVF